MKYLNIKDAIIIHNEIIQETGGLNGHNKEQIKLLESSLELKKMMIIIQHLLIN